MVLNRLFDPLWFNADVTLRGGGTAVLQQPLHQRNIESVGLIYLRSIPLAKTMGTDTLVP